MLALGSQDGLVSIYLFTVYEKDDIGECWVINDCPHVADEAVDGLVINFVFFQFSYV